MAYEETSIIANRMQTILDLYSRDTTIPDLVTKTGLNYNQIQSILSKNNFFHGIKRDKGTKDHPIHALIFYDEFKYLLNYSIIDTLRIS